MRRSGEKGRIKFPSGIFTLPKKLFELGGKTAHTSSNG
jgi:hypothetical protein